MIHYYKIIHNNKTNHKLVFPQLSGWLYRHGSILIAKLEIFSGLLIPQPSSLELQMRKFWLLLAIFGRLLEKTGELTVSKLLPFSTTSSFTKNLKYQN